LSFDTLISNSRVVLDSHMSNSCNRAYRLRRIVFHSLSFMDFLYVHGGPKKVSHYQIIKKSY